MLLHTGKSEIRNPESTIKKDLPLQTSLSISLCKMPGDPSLVFDEIRMTIAGK
ncbi:hypothetical protein ACFLRY_00740 [Bacteroidota bacterium]